MKQNKFAAKVENLLKTYRLAKFVRRSKGYKIKNFKYLSITIHADVVITYLGKINDL